MQEEFLVEEPETRPAKALVARAGLFRTFGSLAGFLALLLLTVGIYLLEDTFSNPLTAQAPALLAAGFVLGLDAVLFYFLMKPRKKMRLAHLHHRRGTSPVHAGLSPLAAAAHHPILPASSDPRERPSPPVHPEQVRTGD